MIAYYGIDCEVWLAHAGDESRQKLEKMRAAF